jgi:HEAT repeat protein
MEESNMLTILNSQGSIFRRCHVLVTLIAGITLSLSNNLTAAEDSFKGKKLDQWIDDIQSENRDSNIRAIRAVGDIGPCAKKAAPSLIALINSSDSQIRIEAIEALGEIGSDSDVVADRIASIFNSTEDYILKRACAIALGKLNKRSADLLAANLKSSDRQLAFLAATGLVSSGKNGTAAISSLVETMISRQKSPEFIFYLCMAAEALGNLARGNRDALPPLITLASHDFELIACACINALTNIAIPDDAASAVVVRRLSINEISLTGCFAAKYCFTMKIEEEEARKYLIHALDSTDITIIEKAGMIIAELNLHDDQIRKKMKELAQSEQSCKRRIALIALTNSEDDCVLAATELLELLDRGEILDRDCIPAVEALIKIGKKVQGSRSGIMRLMENDERDIRKAAMECFKAIEG